VVRRVGLVDPVLVERETGVGGGRSDEAIELAPRCGSGAPGERAPAGRNIVGTADARLPEAVRHLADVDRAIAARLEPDRQVVLVVEALVSALRRRVAEHSGVVRVLARLDSDAGGAAQGIRGVGMQEARALVADQRL